MINTISLPRDQPWGLQLNRLLLIAGVVAGLILCVAPSFAASRSHHVQQRPLTIYVSANGNDLWSGARPSRTGSRADGPLATLQGAIDRIGLLVSRGEVKSRDIAVQIEGGDYRTRLPLTISRLGSADARMVISAYHGQAVVIDGGQSVTGWSRVTDAAILSRLDPSARGHVLQADLGAQGIVDYGDLSGRGFGRPLTPAGLELFYDDKPMTLARWPNQGQWATIATAPGGQNGNSIGYTGDRPDRWLADSDVWLHGYWAFDWADSYEKVDHIDPSKHEIVLSDPQGPFGYVLQHRWYALNILEELDSPGEWYLDRHTGLLYFWPPMDSITGHAVVSMQPSLVSIDTATNLTLNGLTFENCRGTAITITDSSHAILKSCVVRDIGTDGITISNSFDSGVSFCDISQTGDGAVVLNAGDRRTLQRGNCFVSDSRIHDYSRWDRTYRPAVEMDGVGNTVSHNLIFNAPHEAIALSGNDNTVSFNEIHDVCKETGDAGAFYMGRDWTMRGNVVSFNYFHDIGGSAGLVGYSDAVGVYLDDTACGTVVYGNLFVRAGHAVMVGGGRDDSVINNTFVNCKPAVSVDARGLTWAAPGIAPGGGWQMQQKLDNMNWNRPPYSERYPDLQNILSVHFGAPWHDTVEHNIMYDCTNPLQIDQQVGEGLTHVENMIDVDPKFVDCAHGNYELRRGSPAFAYGIQQIPLQSIGPRNPKL